MADLPETAFHRSQIQPLSKLLRKFTVELAKSEQFHSPVFSAQKCKNFMQFHAVRHSPADHQRTFLCPGHLSGKEQIPLQRCLL